MQDTAAVTVPQKSRYPKSVPFIIGNEAAERFSYYGLRSILVTFLVAQFYNPTLNPALTTVAEAKANESPPYTGALGSWVYDRGGEGAALSFMAHLRHLFQSRSSPH